MNGRLGAALLVAASIAAPPLAAWAASGSPGGTIPIPGTAFRLGMPLSLVDSMVSMRIAGRPSSPKRRNGLSRFFGLDAATTLDFESARLTHARFELKEISTHSRDYIEDQLRREGLKPQCALWDAEHHDCDWSNGSVMHVTWEQGSLTADVAAPEAGAVGAASVASSAPAMSAPAEASPSAPASAAAGLAALPMLVGHVVHRLAGRKLSFASRAHAGAARAAGLSRGGAPGGRPGRGAAGGDGGRARPGEEHRDPAQHSRTRPRGGGSRAQLQLRPARTAGHSAGIPRRGPGAVHEVRPMLLLDSRAMRRLDQLTMSGGHASGETLMERAGAGVAQAMERRYGPLLGLRVLVLCGGGNNGGDGFVAARHLRARGARPDVVLLAAREAVKGDARAHLERLEADTGPVRMAASEADVIAAVASRDGWDFALDALLGTGSRGEPEGLIAAGVEQLRLMDERGTRVVAVDLPTGVSADTGAIARRAVRADLTVTFGAPKIGHVLYPGRAFTGALEVVDIGLVDAPAEDPEYRVELATAESLSALVRERDPRAHKGSVGRVLVIGGSPGLTGAVALAARGATRAGAGYVQMLVPAALESLVAAQRVEEMTLAVPPKASRTLGRAALPMARQRAAAADAVVLGSGLSRESGAMALARTLISGLRQPTVVDADALFALAGHTRLLRKAPAPRVLTPHLGEMSRLTGIPAETLESDRIALARRFAGEWGVVVVLKGAPTVTAAPDGRAAVNSTGNPGMATAGAGDVLAGAIGALVASGLSAYDGARLGVFVHGLAGDQAAAAVGPVGLAAGDLGERLPSALRELARRRDALAAAARRPAASRESASAETRRPASRRDAGPGSRNDR